MCIYTCVWWFILTWDLYISNKIWPTQTKNHSSAPVEPLKFFSNDLLHEQINLVRMNKNLWYSNKLLKDL